MSRRRGQPFLVNRTAAILTQEVVQERTRPITMADLRAALQKLVHESNYNFETIVRRRKIRRTPCSKLFLAAWQFTLNNPMVMELALFGILRERPDGNCQVTNPIYKQVLIDYLRPINADSRGRCW